MAKYIINEEALERIVRESVVEVLEEGERFNNLMNKAGRAVGNIRNGIKNSGGVAQYLAGQYGKAERGIQNWKNSVSQAYRAGRAASDAAMLQQNHPVKYWETKYGPEFAAKMGEIMGGSYPKDRLIQALNAYKVSPEDQEKILAQKGYSSQQQGQGNSGIEPEVSPMVNNPQQTGAQQQNVKKGGFQPKSARPIADIQAQVTNGRLLSKADGQLVSAALGEYKKNHPEINEESIKNAVSESLKKYLKEQGETYKGQEKLGRLSQRRLNQCMDAKRSGDDKKGGEYMKRSLAAYDKAKEERDKKYKDGDIAKHQMASAFHDGEKKEKRKR